MECIVCFFFLATNFHWMRLFVLRVLPVENALHVGKRRWLSYVAIGRSLCKIWISAVGNVTKVRILFHQNARRTSTDEPLGGRPVHRNVANLMKRYDNCGHSDLNLEVKSCLLSICRCTLERICSRKTNYDGWKLTIKRHNTSNTRNTVTTNQTKNHIGNSEYVLRYFPV